MKVCHVPISRFITRFTKGKIGFEKFLLVKFIYMLKKKKGQYIFFLFHLENNTDINTKTQSVQYKETLNKNSMWENGSEKVIPCKDFERGSLSSTSSVSDGPALEYKDKTSKVIPKIYFGSL